MKHYAKIMAAALALLAASCQKADGPDLGGKSPKGSVQFATSATRVSGDAWQPADAIGVFMFTHGQTLAAGLIEGASNKKYVTASGDGQFTYDTSDQLLCFPKDGTVDFVAYYPYTSPITGFARSIDVTDQSAPAAIDLLRAATTAGYGSETAGAVPLTFNHMLSKLVIQLGERDRNSLAGATVTVSGMKRQASLDLSTGALTDVAASTGDVSVPVAVSNKLYTATGAAIVLPFAAARGKSVTITVPSTSKTFTWDIPPMDACAPGQVRTYTLELNSKNSRVSTLAVDIAEWAPVEMKIEAVSGAARTRLAPVSGQAAVWEGTVAMAANSQFKIAIDNVEYGYEAYSGNGGVGVITSAVKAATYFTRLGDDNYVRSSYGLLSASGEPAWVNTAAASDVYLRVDLTDDSNPTCYAALVDHDPNLVLSQYFDLNVWGGSWLAGSGTGRLCIAISAGGLAAIQDFKGYEPATKVTNVAGTQTGPGPLNSADPNHSAFLSVRGLAGWTLSNCYEFAGCVRLSDTDAGGAKTGEIATPALSAIGAGTATLTVTYDVARFVALDPVAFMVQGAGTITAASYQDIYDSGVTYCNNVAGTQPGPDSRQITVAGGATEFLMTARNATLTTGMSPEFNGVNSYQKFYTRFTVTVTGATSQTKLRWQGRPTGDSKAVRMMLDNIRVTKQ